MRPITHADLVALARQHDPPCVSLHVPVDGREGSGPAALKLANAARSVRPALEAWAAGEATRAAAAGEVTRHLDGMVGELSERPWESADAAWIAPTRGLSLFASPHFSAIHRLPAAPAEVAACDTSFRTRPLLEQHASDLAFHLLAIHRDEVRLFDGSAERLDERPLGDIPRTMELAVGREWDDSQHGRGFHGAPAAGKGRGNAAAAGVHMHGFGGGDKEDDKDLQRFLQRIGQGLPRRIGAADGPPLVVMGTDRNLGLFRKLHPNVQIENGGVAFDPRGRSAEELHGKAWAALESARSRRISGALEAVEAGTPRGRASKDLQAIAKAAVAGRVATLVLARGRHDAGAMDPVTGELRLDGPGHAGPDVLETIASTVLLHRGDLLVADHAQLQAHAGATFRY